LLDILQVHSKTYFELELVQKCKQFSNYKKTKQTNKQKTAKTLKQLKYKKK